MNAARGECAVKGPVPPMASRRKKGGFLGVRLRGWVVLLALLAAVIRFGFWTILKWAAILFGLLFIVSVCLELFCRWRELNRVEEAARNLELFPVGRGKKRQSPKKVTLKATAGEIRAMERSLAVDALSRQKSRSNDPSHAIRWHGKGKTVRVGPYVLNDPLTYFSDGPAEVLEASCIDLSLPIGRPLQQGAGNLGHYPDYSSLTLDERATYLEWLAGGRNSELEKIGYAFLFFFGLERRLLVDRQDLGLIIEEAVRLLARYTSSGSFDAYLGRFLAYALARANIETLKEDRFLAVFEQSRAQNDDQNLAVVLAWFFSQGRPLPSHWAYRLAHRDPRAARSVVLKRLPEEFARLFSKRYRDRFGEGMLLKASRREYSVSYHPASPSLLDLGEVFGNISPARVPNVLGIQSQFDPLVQIWAECIDDLRRSSRQRVSATESLTREAYEALPEDIKADVEHPDEPDWKRLAAAHTGENGVAILEVSQLALLQDTVKRLILTPKQSERLATTAQDVGFLIEPDARITNRPYAWDDVVALFRAEDKPGLPTDPSFTAASTMLQLGMFVAAADGTVHDDEVTHIARCLESRFLLNPADARRLEALQQVFLKKTPSISRLGKRLHDALSVQEREAIGEFLVSVASATGNIHPSEVAALRSAYKALGIEVARLTQLLDDYRRASKEPVEVQPGTRRASPGEAIPEPFEEPSKPVILNEEILRRKFAETREVEGILAKAMSTPEVVIKEPSDRAARVSEPVADPRFNGLDVRYHTALSELIRRPAWSKDDFEELVRRHGLMPSGAFDAINEWALERLDDTILEEQGNDLFVQSTLIAQNA
jgi:uncharacterized tellurite resistance protein B-like protein